MARDEIGVIKEGPVRRYLDGQKAWDDKFGECLAIACADLN
jgi:hypothetical protein